MKRFLVLHLGLAWAGLLALAKITLLLLGSSRSYGYFRDEFYFLDAPERGGRPGMDVFSNVRFARLYQSDPKLVQDLGTLMIHGMHGPASNSSISP